MVVSAGEDRREISPASAMKLRLSRYPSGLRLPTVRHPWLCQRLLSLRP